MRYTVHNTNFLTHSIDSGKITNSPPPFIRLIYDLSDGIDIEIILLLTTNAWKIVDIYICIYKSDY